MGTRVPIRIYKLSDALYTGTTGIKIPIKEWDYIQGKTLEDVILLTDSGWRQMGPLIENAYYYGFIDLNNENLDGADSITRYYQVYLGEEGYFVVHETKRYYLKSGASEARPSSPAPPVFEFYINPERITPTYRKLITETRTRGGWDIQHWGEQLTEIRVEGRTGGLIKGNFSEGFTNSVPGANKNIDITKSDAWIRLNQLKKLYDEDHKNNGNDEFLTKLGFNYYDKFYVGYFIEFTGPNADAEKPYIMNYSFTFKVESGGEYTMDAALDNLNLPIETIGEG